MNKLLNKNSVPLREHCVKFHLVGHSLEYIYNTKPGLAQSV